MVATCLSPWNLGYIPRQLRSTMPRVDVKKAQKRPLHFNSFTDLRTELNRLEAAHHAGTLTTTGNWTPGQNLHHVATWIAGYLDGVTIKIALPLRLVGPFLKKRFMTKGYPPGLPVPGGMRPDECSFEEGAAHLRAQLDRLDAGASLEGPNPFFGHLTHDEATRIHLRHAEHHLGYLHVE